MKLPFVSRDASAVPVFTLSKATYAAWLKRQSATARNWLKASGFAAEPSAFAPVPDADGKLAAVAAGVSETPDLWAIAALPDALPPGNYQLAETKNAESYALGWALGAYRFSRYKKREKEPARLVCDNARVKAQAEAIYLARDLINAPANDMLPSHLAAACMAVAKECGTEIRVIEGEALLKENYPLVHAVGKASADAPRLIDIRWGKKNAPKVTLVGKGVCFDSGGLDIKPASAMRLMKKDMAGAAICLALGQLIMTLGLKIRLRILIPAVENAVGGHAMRPLDIVKTRKGLTVEIGNTDAEGRLILADALAEADSEKPDLIIDCSTLTGAARVALGTEIPAFFTPDDQLAALLAKASAVVSDPLYRLPLAAQYRDMLKSNAADLSNDTDSPYAGSITAALFLKEFVEATPRWLHLDMMAWNLKAQPGRPMGGEAQGLRALFALLEELYG